MNKKIICIITLSACMILTGCSGGSGSTSVSDYKSAPAAEVATASVDSGFYNGFDSYSYDDYEDSYAEDESYGGYGEDKGYEYEESQIDEPDTEASKINKEMLIYHGDINITTKQFSKDLESLKSTLKSFDCFFENERMWTDQQYDDRTISHYSATVRVSSKEYDSLLDGLNEIGTVTNLSSSCDNVSAEYSDTVVAIDIYQAERDRYAKLLSTIQDEQYAMQIQQKLTDIDLTLAQYNARKQNIETDVAYSYVTVELSEVREYVQQTQYNDNFFKRLWNTVMNTFFGFLTFLENFLFFLIRISPYLLFFFILYKSLKKIGFIRWLSSTWLFKMLRGKYDDYMSKRKKHAEDLAERRKRIEDLNRQSQQGNVPFVQSDKLNDEK